MRLLSNLLRKSSPTPVNFGAPGVDATTPYEKPKDGSEKPSKNADAKNTKASSKSEAKSNESEAKKDNQLYAGVQLKSTSINIQQSSNANSTNPYANVSLKPIADIGQKKQSNVVVPAPSNTASASSNTAPASSITAPASSTTAPASSKIAQPATSPNNSSAVQQANNNDRSSPIAKADTTATTIKAQQPLTEKAPQSSARSAHESASSQQIETSEVKQPSQYTAHAHDTVVRKSTSPQSSVAGTEERKQEAITESSDWQIQKTRKRTTSRAGHDFEIVKMDEVRAAMDRAAREPVVESNESLSNDQAFAKAYSRLNV